MERLEPLQKRLQILQSFRVKMSHFLPILKFATIRSTNKKTLRNTWVSQGFRQSERQDLNLRPLRPERSALARLSYAPMIMGWGNGS
jgi:hypothetical protein